MLLFFVLSKDDVYARNTASNFDLVAVNFTKKNRHVNKGGKSVKFCSTCGSYFHTKAGQSMENAIKKHELTCGFQFSEPSLYALGNLQTGRSKMFPTFHCGNILQVAFRTHREYQQDFLV